MHNLPITSHYHHCQILWSRRSTVVACAHPINLFLYFAIFCVVSSLICVCAGKSFQLPPSSKTSTKAHRVQMRWHHRSARNCGVSMVEPFRAAQLKACDFDMSILRMPFDTYLPQHWSFTRSYPIPTGSPWFSRVGSRKSQFFQFKTRWIR